MYETKRQKWIGVFAQYLPEIKNLYDQINDYKKEASRISSLKSKTTKNYLKCRKLASRYRFLNSKRNLLEELAEDKIKEFTQYMLTSDNPNIHEVRKELFFVTKMVIDHG